MLGSSMGMGGVGTTPIPVQVIISIVDLLQHSQQVGMLSIGTCGDLACDRLARATR